MRPLDVPGLGLGVLTLGLLRLAVLLLFGCAMPGAAQGQQPDTPQEVPEQPRRSFIPPDWAPLPQDLRIVIIREDLIPGQFRILDVELSRRVDEETLATLANVLKDSDDMIYQRTYIVYYLPGMRSGTRGWATAHFLPQLEVRLVDPL